MRAITSVLQRRKRTVRAAISLTLIALLVSWIGPRRLIEPLATAPYHWIVPWIVAYDLVANFLWGTGLYALLHHARAGGYRRVVASAYKVQILSVVVPGRLADLGTLHFWRDLHPPARIVAVQIIDKAITLPVTLTLGAIGIARFWGPGALVVPLAVLAIVAVLVASTGALRRALWSRAPARWKSSLDGVGQEMRAAVRDGRGIAINAGLTLVRVSLAGISFSTLLGWFGVEAPLLDVFLVQALAQLVCLLPITLLGIGLMDGVNVALLERLGAAPERVLATGVAGTAAHLLFIVGAFAVWQAVRWVSQAPCHRGSEAISSRCTEHPIVSSE